MTRLEHYQWYTTFLDKNEQFKFLTEEEKREEAEWYANFIATGGY